MVTQLVLRVLSIALIGASLVGGTANASSLERDGAPILFGIASEDFRTDMATLESATGRPPAFVQLFWQIETGWPQTWATGILDDVSEAGATPYIEVNTAGGDEDAYEQFQAGDLDADLRAMAEMIDDWLDAGADRRVLIAPFAEPNLPEHPWGGDPDGARAAYEKVVEAFRSAGATPDQARFVWSINGGMPVGEEYIDYYPGDQLVDIIGFSKLNRGAPWRDYEATMGVYIGEIQQELSRTKPILVAQTGSVSEGGDRSAWLRDMFRNLVAEEQVIGAVYFNRDKFEAGKDNDYRIVVGSAVDPTVVSEAPLWSDPSEVAWIFNGGLDAWVADRQEELDRAGGFIDMVDSIFASDVAWMVEQGITAGCAPDRYCPDEPVTRGQMAAFLVRALELPASSGDPFLDDDGSVFEDDIERLATAGITRGCGDTAFCPNDNVTRGQMAAFLRRALEGRLLEGDEVAFTDDDGSVFENDIEWLAATGVTRGCDANRFCPDESVTRGQMAAFLRRALG